MDDNPICVVDATTLVEHIHEIKRYVYQGRVCLLVPQRTSTTLEQKYAKLTEEANKKPAKQTESQRPRSIGKPGRFEKPAKTEPPAMDINPLVAGEFLSRCRCDEGGKGVEFQKDSEQYSPWRLLELEEESKNTNENKPTSFAQAARKASMEKFATNSGVANSSAKPRLIARSTAVDSSPWKTSNKALSLPISEVPKETRPLLSCLLWRLHEKGATLWDKNRTYLLCDNEKTTALAKKLGIATRSMLELQELCNTKKVVNERRETFGDLEEHFNLPEVVTATPSHDVGKEATGIHILPTMDHTGKENCNVSGAPEQIKDPEPCSSAQEGTESEGSSTSKKKGDKPHSQEVSKPGHDQPAGKDADSHSTAQSTGREKRTGSNQEVTGPANVAPYQEPVENGQAAVQPSQPVFNTLDAEKEHSIAAWVKGLMDAANSNEHSGQDMSMSGHSSTKPFKPLTYLQAVTGKADETVKNPDPLPPMEIMRSPYSSPPRQPSPPRAEAPIDSEEEEIVFNPKAKRLSAQKAHQAQQAQQGQPTPQAPQNEQAQRPQTPKSSPRHGHARNVSGGRAHIRGGFHRQPRPGPPPVVIDPDSFGRGLVTNPQPSVARTFSPYGAQGRVANDRRGNHRSPNMRPSAHITPPKVNGATLPNGSANIATLPAAEQPAATGNFSVVDPVPAVQSTNMSTPPSLLKPSATINGPPAGSLLPGTSPLVNGLQMQNSQGFPLRAEKSRYSPRGSPRQTPIMPEPEVGYILRSGQPREATRGRGKLWVP
ncbi:MAG: hypothetical protein L6R39_003518 [Caloplaca ligustica]|nr:MAG: hypothetical protein L6R39_003518 [Caloplaca ligustica]